MARNSNGMGSIIVSIVKGKKYYKGQVTLGYDVYGKQIRKSFGSTKKRELIDKMNKAKFEYKNKDVSNLNVKFNDFFKYWIENFKKIEISNNSYVKYTTTYELRIAPYSIFKKKASAITLNELQFYFSSLTKRFSPATVKQTYIHINACMNFAVLQGAIHKNFCPGITLEKVVKDNKIKCFSKNEQTLILEHLKKNDIIDNIIYITFFTGLRLGEVLGLQWNNINGNMLNIKQQYARVRLKNGVSYKLQNLKTLSSEREIPLTSKVLKILSKIPKTSPLIFSSNGKGIDHKRPQRRMISICNELSIPYRSFHAIRHSYATRLFEMNVPIKTVQVMLGHSDISTTMNVYTHVMKEQKIELLEALENL